MSTFFFFFLNNVGRSQQCSTSKKCIYLAKYGNGSFTTGYFSKERLTITSDVKDNFIFGCGQDNEGLFNGFAGLLSLGRAQVSLVKQTAQKYGQFFSYCLPSTTSSTDHLTFGKRQWSFQYHKVHTYVKAFSRAIILWH